VLIDTYDTERGARRAAALAAELKQSAAAARLQGVRIDSGDLGAEARLVRQILDTGGAGEVEIILSGGLDEYRIDSLLQAGTPVDAFGVGTRLDVSEDAPSLDMAYKLQEYAGRARRKRSPGKETWPGRKQVFRQRDAGGSLCGDSIALADESLPGEALLQEVMRDGRRVAELPALDALRAGCLGRLAELSPALRSLQVVEDPYPVRVTDAVRALARSIDVTGD
jgi:nicotinate phosphoribosyltransferase